jgi:hypothetical protein
MRGDRRRCGVACPTCEDAEWLIVMGESPDMVAHRLGFRNLDRYQARESLRKHLRDHGRRDLSDRLRIEVPA